MAGDWIKFEHATVDKPEVARVAELLNVTPEHALGLALRFWVWFDQNSRNGVVTPCYTKSVEGLMHCPGFVAAMSDVRWLELDENSHRLTIPNVDRHNGKTAKSRALARDRQQNYRNASVTPPSRPHNANVTQSASPEKRREEVKIKDDVDVKGTLGEKSDALGQKPVDKIPEQPPTATPKPAPRTREEQIAIARAASTPEQIAKAKARVRPEPAAQTTAAPSTSPGAARLAAMQAAQQANGSAHPNAWMETGKGIEAKAAELGIRPQDGDTLRILKARCLSEIARRGG